METGFVPVQMVSQTRRCSQLPKTHHLEVNEGAITVILSEKLPSSAGDHQFGYVRLS